MNKVHRCLRCGEEFECPVPDICEAGYDVFPRHVVLEDGKPRVAEHCPDALRAELARKGGEGG